MLSIIEGAVVFLSLSAVLTMVVGFLMAFGSYILDSRRLSAEENFNKFKPRFARTLLVALEILVVADVIETVTVDASFESLFTLGLLVIVRTWLSWTLGLEAEGRWPWQSGLEE